MSVGQCDLGIVGKRTFAPPDGDRTSKRSYQNRAPDIVGLSRRKSRMPETSRPPLQLNRSAPSEAFIFDASGGSRQNKCRVLLDWGEHLHRFLSVTFNDGPAGDGSLYLTLDRVSRRRWDPATDAPLTCEDLGKYPELPKLKLSYHATGRIHLSGLSGGREVRRYGEPTFAVSQPLPLFVVSIPGPRALDSFEEAVSATDFVAKPLEAGRERSSFDLWILPDRDDAVPIGALVVKYEGWFRIAVVASPNHPPLQPGAELAVITMVPDQGLFPRQVLDRHQALGFFHRKITGSQGIVSYWNPNKHEFRVIFAVPMRVPPRLEVDLEDPNLRVDIVRVTESEARFVVVGPGGRLSSPPRLVKIIADSEL
jgi:hypothetical protein